jgi:transcription termination factor Rho
VTLLRRTLNSMNPVEAMERLVSRLAKFSSNAEFVQMIGGTPAVYA